MTHLCLRSPRATPGSRRPASSAAARLAPSGGCSLPTARRPSRRALAVAGCVVEVFATASASEQYADLRDAAPGCARRRRPRPRLALRLRHPGRRRRGLPLPRRAARARRCDARPPAGHLRRRPRPRQRRHGDPHGRRGRRRRGRAGRAVRRRLQPQDGAGHRRQPVPPARRDRARRRRSRRGGAGAPASRCWPPTARARSTFRRGADGLLAGPTAWLFGNEAWGLRPRLAALADHRVRIPIHGRAESLNLSTAAAVCLYASAAAHMAPAPILSRLRPVAWTRATPWTRCADGVGHPRSRRIGPPGQPGGRSAASASTAPTAWAARSPRPSRSPTTTAAPGWTFNSPFEGPHTRTGVPEQSWLLPDGTEALTTARIRARRTARAGHRRSPSRLAAGAAAAPRPGALRPRGHRRPRAALAR